MTDTLVLDALNSIKSDMKEVKTALGGNNLGAVGMREQLSNTNTQLQTLSTEYQKLQTTVDKIKQNQWKVMSIVSFCSMIFGGVIGLVTKFYIPFK